MTTRSFSFAAMALIGLALFLAGSVDVTNAQQPASGAIPIDNDDLGGIVTSAKGPEAGVWVIAETTDLPTRLIKSAVTDDRGRYLLPDLPKANYRVCGAWLWSGRFAEGADRARKTPEPYRGRRAKCARGGRVLPGGLLVLIDAGAGQERISRQRRGREWRCANHEKPGRVAQIAEEWRLLGVPSAREQSHARAAQGPGHVLIVASCMGSPHTGRTGRQADERRAQSVRPPARVGAVRRLDRSHCQG